MSEFQKPPLGLTPRWVHDEQRMEDILNAIERYADANMSIPKEWVEELKDLKIKLILGMKFNPKMIQIDMEMPEDCAHCRFMDTHLDCRAKLDKSGTSLYSQFHCEPTDKRQDFCPLIKC